MRENRHRGAREQGQNQPSHQKVLMDGRRLQPLPPVPKTDPDTTRPQKDGVMTSTNTIYFQAAGSFSARASRSGDNIQIAWPRSLQEGFAHGHRTSFVRLYWKALQPRRYRNSKRGHRNSMIHKWSQPRLATLES